MSHEKKRRDSELSLLLRLPPKREPFVNGAEGCVRETRKGVLHDDDPHFSELFEALKNASAWRKDLFDTLRRAAAATRLMKICCDCVHSIRTQWL